MDSLNYYNGAFQTSLNGGTFPVVNPFDGAVVGSAVDSCPEDIQLAIDSTIAGFEVWKHHTAKERGRLLYRLYESVIEASDELAHIMTLEQGKPLKESRIEVHYAASFIKWYAEEATRISGDILEPNHHNQRIAVLKEPVGPVFIITPWNFPLAMITRKLAPALAAGCSVLVKPSEETPLTAFKFFEILHKVNFPPKVVNFITGNPKLIGETVMNSAGIRKVSFTGSTAVGQLLVVQSAKTMKKLSLELGGHAPLIVFEDADLSKAVQGTLDSKFRNCGQVCIATNRVYVQAGIFDDYVMALKKAVENLKSGSGFEDVDLGPIINQAGFDKIQNQVADALAKGATLDYGGSGSSEGQNHGYFFQPTILSQMKKEMRMMSEETFGPIVPITVFDTEEEAIALANDSPFGLASYFFTENLSRAYRVQGALAYGMVGVNTGKISSEQVPFGGVKLSGYGREGGTYGLEEYLQTKYVCTTL